MASFLSTQKTLEAMFFSIEVGQVVLAAMVLAPFFLLKMAARGSCYDKKSTSRYTLEENTCGFSIIRRNYATCLRFSWRKHGKSTHQNGSW